MINRTLAAFCCCVCATTTAVDEDAFDTTAELHAASIAILIAGGRCRPKSSTPLHLLLL
jgi:hypothetical protein